LLYICQPTLRERYKGPTARTYVDGKLSGPSAQWLSTRASKGGVGVSTVMFVPMAALRTELGVSIPATVPTVVGIYFVGVSPVANRWWWWHTAHRAVQLLLIEDGRCPAQEQRAGSRPTCARSQIRMAHEGSWIQYDKLGGRILMYTIM
jgi:hypothetical protein